MENKFKVGDEVLQKFFPDAPRMIVVHQIGDGQYICRWFLDQNYSSSLFYEDELKPGFDEVFNQTICRGDLVRHAHLKGGPVMWVVFDYGNERLFGCRYLKDGVLHYGDFLQEELELLSDEETDYYSEHGNLESKSINFR